VSRAAAPAAAGSPLVLGRREDIDAVRYALRFLLANWDQVVDLAEEGGDLPPFEPELVEAVLAQVPDTVTP